MKKRIHSTSDCELIIIRGANRQKIVIDESDRVRLAKTIERYAEKLKIKIAAYSIAGSSVRIMITEGCLSAGEFVKRIASSYVRHYFNNKYDRCGNLFAQRYLIETSEEAGDAVLLAKETLAFCLKTGKSYEIGHFDAREITEMLSKTSKVMSSEGNLMRNGVQKSLALYVTKAEPLYLGKLAYTPKKNVVASYIKTASQGMGLMNISIARAKYLLRSLRANRVSFKTIAVITRTNETFLRSIIRA